MPVPNLKLVSHHLCPYVQRARIVLAEKHIPHDLEYIDLSRKPDWFTELSPLGKVPLLISDGRALFESAPIAEYLDEVTPGSLHPEDAFERARNRAWIEFASSTLDVMAGFYNARDEDTFRSRTGELRRRLRTLDGSIQAAPYFDGDRFGLVDAAFGPLFRYFDVIETFADLGFFEGTPAVTRWRRALAQRPSVRDAVTADYPQQLLRFFAERQSVLSRLLADAADETNRAGGGLTG